MSSAAVAALPDADLYQLAGRRSLPLPGRGACVFMLFTPRSHLVYSKPRLGLRRENSISSPTIYPELLTTHKLAVEGAGARAPYAARVCEELTSPGR